MSELKLCQGNKCHTYHTKDRIRGVQGDKHYETRRRRNFYYGNNNFCSLNCQNDWFELNGDRAIDHFGRLRESKRANCNDAWYKDYRWSSGQTYDYFFINDLLGKKVLLTEEQYNNPNYILNTS